MHGLIIDIRTLFNALILDCDQFNSPINGKLEAHGVNIVEISLVNYFSS